MTIKKIKTAVIGCGWIAVGAETDLLRREPKTHSGAINSLTNFELVAFQDPDPDALKRASQLFPGVPTYLESEQLYKNEKLDAVVICSDAEHHVKIIQTAISYGISNILCEKPLSLNLEETRQLINQLKKTKTKLLINHMRRFQVQNEDLRDYLTRDYINDTLTGNIISGVAFYDKGVFHCGTHIIDLLIFFFGKVKCVSAVYSSVFVSTQDDFFVEATLEFENAQISLKPFENKNYSLCEIWLFGETGAIKLSDMWGQQIEFFGTANNLSYSAYRELDANKKRVIKSSTEFMTGTYDAFYNYICGTKNYNFLNDVLHGLEVMNALKESAEAQGTKKRIKN